MGSKSPLKKWEGDTMIKDELEVVYKVSHVTDKEGNSKEHIEDINTKYIPYVVKVGQSAILAYTGDSTRCLKTSTVQEVAYIHNMLVIKTLNTVYWLKPIAIKQEW
jgi:hypothetical protein